MRIDAVCGFDDTICEIRASRGKNLRLTPHADTRCDYPGYHLAGLTYNENYGS